MTPGMDLTVSADALGPAKTVVLREPAWASRPSW